MCGLYDSNNIFSKLNVMLDRPNKIENRRKEKEAVSENKEIEKEKKTVDEKAEIEKEKEIVDGNSKTDESSNTGKEIVNGNGKNKKEKKEENDTVDVKQVVMKKIWTYVIADWQGFTQVALFNNSPHFSLLQIVIM